MLRIDKEKQELVRLEHVTMQKAGYWETRDLQALICRNPGQFCKELGEEIWFVGAETRPSDASQNRIDLLGVDSEGVAVVVELKRDSNKLQLLQSLTYAAMIADWQPDQFAGALSKFNAKFGEKKNQSIDEAQVELAEMLDEGDIDSINRRQRIVLLAEHFDYEVLATAGWLSEKYEVDIRCYRLEIARLHGSLFLTCTNTFPPPELKEIALKRRFGVRDQPTEPPTWDAVFSKITNPAVVNFFRSEIEAGVANRSDRRRIHYAVEKKRPFRVSAKRNFAGVFQAGRFEDDIQFWKSRLGTNAMVRDVYAKTGLRFRLYDPDDFKRFKEGVGSQGPLVKSRTLADGDEIEDDEAE